MLEREEAHKVVRSLDDAGFACVLRVAVHERDARDYEVTVNLEGFSGQRLADLQGLLNAFVPDSHSTVTDYGQLRVW
jgi:hypothetical protein